MNCLFLPKYLILLYLFPKRKHFMSSLQNIGIANTYTVPLLVLLEHMHFTTMTVDTINKMAAKRLTGR